MKSLILALGLFSTMPAFAQMSGDGSVGSERRARSGMELGGVEVGARVGLTKVMDLGDPVLSYGAFGDVAASNHVLLGGAIDYWQKSSGTLGATTTEVSDFSVTADSKFIFTSVQSTLRPFAKVGVTEHRFEVKELQVSAINDRSAISDHYRGVSGETGLDFGAGVTYALQGESDILGEMVYRNIMKSGASLDQVAFAAGLAYRL